MAKAAPPALVSLLADGRNRVSTMNSERASPNALMQVASMGEDPERARLMLQHRADQLMRGLNIVLDTTPVVFTAEEGVPYSICQ